MFTEYKKEVFDWETAIIARTETEKSRDQCLRSFNNFKDREKRRFWWEGLLKKTCELIEIEEIIKRLEAVVDDKATDRLQ